MRLEPVSILGTLREVWSMPRDMARFREYLARLTGDGDVLLPLVAANPMARDHMLAFLDRLEAVGADEVVAQACAEAQRRLAHVPVETRVSLTPVDDLGGAWSERTLMDFDARFPDRLAKRGTAERYRFIGALAYVTETPTAALVRERVLAAVYRAAWIRAHGAALTVRDMMRQEGNALRFAGLTSTEALDVEAARRALAPHLDARDHPTRFAAMYGDAAAKRVGHKPLGAPPNGGFVLGLADALREVAPPERLV